MRLAVVLGTRPEIIKMAPIIRAADRAGVSCDLIHTGQHYSYAMDGVFFADLELRQPDFNLGVGSGSHPHQISTIVRELEAVLESRRPDIVLVEGDTNSVLAAALTANKMAMRVGHVEAGLRSRDRAMPEEINRILADHVSDVLFAPTATAVSNLRSEGIPASRIFFTGNTVVDEVMRHRSRARRRNTARKFGVTPGSYGVATVHRAENVADDSRLTGIVRGLERAGHDLEIPVLLSLHPRTAARLDRLGLEFGAAVRPLTPLGYLDFLSLHESAALVLTDSGGLQEEACILGIPCVTIRDTTERPESIEIGASMLAGADPEQISAAARKMIRADRNWPNPFGDGRSGERIVDAVQRDAASDGVVAIPIQPEATSPVGRALSLDNRALSAAPAQVEDPGVQ